MKIGCQRTVSKGQMTPHHLFANDVDYIITPTYMTRAELDEKVQILRQTAVQRGYTDGRLPVRIFLQVFGMRESSNSMEYHRVVLLDSGDIHMIRDNNNRPRYYYMRFNAEKTESYRDPLQMNTHGVNLNTYVG